jgi:multidrug resistance efflux pump
MSILERMSGEEILSRIDDRITEMSRIGAEVAQAEAQFKAYEASTKSALIDSGMSAVQAEAQMRGGPEWAGRFVELEEARVRLAEVRARIDQGIRYFELWRSRYSAEARVTR